jgi:hypothetical protein
MSFSRRSKEHSNAAIVVSVSPEDFPGGPLSGIEFQRKIERAAFLAGGGKYYAPAQRITSFLSDKAESALPASSYKPGITASSLTCLPDWILSELKMAIRHFDMKMKGFITTEAMLIGAETRTSSPVRITRDASMQSITLPGLYPAGEGAGYAGGIISSAVDGIRAADSILMKYR